MRSIHVLSLICGALLIVGGTADRATSRHELDETPAADVEAQESEDRAATTSDQAAAAAFRIDWISINAGGENGATSTQYGVSYSIGQTITGEGSSTNYGIGLGFWYGVEPVAGSCPIAISGDVNVTGSVSSADIIYMVNFVFKGGPAAMPCEASGDVNCSGGITSADIIHLVNFVFKGGPDPCDICTLIPGVWSCP